MELQLWRKHFPMPVNTKENVSFWSVYPDLSWYGVREHVMNCELCSWQLCPAEYTLWDLVHLFADDKIILRMCMHMHRKARVGFLMLREDIFQKTIPDQIGTHYFISVQPLLRAWCMILVQIVSWGMQPGPALWATKYSLPSQFPSQGCVWCCASPKWHSSVKCWVSSSGSDTLSSYWSLKWLTSLLLDFMNTTGLMCYDMQPRNVFAPEMRKLQIQLGNGNDSRLLQCF